MNNAILKNTQISYLYNTIYLPPITQLPSFTAISSCLIDHIIGTDLLSQNEKLYYLVNDFYNQSLKE